ncbi:MAG TPA: hypothetical protein VEF53_18270 [Patescibacteria group bacterium]|nr:hypothetical protein [Patescibacteria group bacterium]
MKRKITWEQVKKVKEINTGELFFDGKLICDLLGVNISDADGKEVMIVHIGDGLCIKADTSMAVPALTDSAVIHMFDKSKNPVLKLILGMIQPIFSRRK